MEAECGMMDKDVEGLGVGEADDGRWLGGYNVCCSSDGRTRGTNFTIRQGTSVAK